MANEDLDPILREYIAAAEACDGGPILDRGRNETRFGRAYAALQADLAGVAQPLPANATLAVDARDEYESLTGVRSTGAVELGAVERWTELVDEYAEAQVYCGGCGDEINASYATWHNGSGYCTGCEAAPAEPEGK